MSVTGRSPFNGAAAVFLVSGFICCDTITVAWVWGVFRIPIDLSSKKRQNVDVCFPSSFNLMEGC